MQFGERRGPLVERLLLDRINAILQSIIVGRQVLALLITGDHEYSSAGTSRP